MAGSWIFYTTFPKIPLINPEFKNIAQFAPPLGFLIGTIQSYIFLFLRTNSWSIYASTLICLASGYLITGGLHIDGLMDTFHLELFQIMLDLISDESQHIFVTMHEFFVKSPLHHFR